MRTHSALHVLCGVVWRDHGASVTGGNMEPLAGRMDFEFETMSGELVGEIERRVNEEIAARPRDPRCHPSARGGVRHPRPHSHQDQPAARRHHRGAHDRDRRARPPGGRRHPRGEHRGDRARAGDRLREQGPHQQAHPDRGHRLGWRASFAPGVTSAAVTPPSRQSAYVIRRFRLRGPASTHRCDA